VEAGYGFAMSTAENNDDNKLSPEERQKVAEFLRGQNEATLRDASLASPAIKYVPPDVFEASMKKVFNENRELLARLAK